MEKIKISKLAFIPLAIFVVNFTIYLLIKVYEVVYIYSSVAKRTYIYIYIYMFPNECTRFYNNYILCCKFFDLQEKFLECYTLFAVNGIYILFLFCSVNMGQLVTNNS